MKPTSLETFNTLPVPEYIEKLESLYEYSPWVVERSAALRPFATLKAMHASLESVIFGSSLEEQLSLLAAHPDLAAKLEQVASLTKFSQAEQARAGFASLPAETLQELRDELARYREKFPHPFVLCVTEHQAVETLPIVQARLQASPASERLACLAQVTRIGWHRLQQLVSQ